MAMKWFFGWACLLLVLAGCVPSAPTSPSEQALASAVAATLEHLPSPELTLEPATKTVPPTPTSTAEPTVAWRLAYTDHGDLWLLEEGADPRRLTHLGQIISARFSPDGQALLYERQDEQTDLYELRYILIDGSGDRLLLDHGPLDAIYPLEGALHILPAQFEFTPDALGVFFNTRRGFEGPGLVKNDDLLRYDLGSGVIDPILPPGAGGDFTPSPDGTMLAIVRPTALHVVWADGRPLAFSPVSFPSVITYSEYAFYPPVVWSADSSRFGSLIPSADPFAPGAGGQVWIVGVPDGDLQAHNFFEGQTLFPQSGGRSLLSPSLDQIAYFRETGETNIVDLVIAGLDGSELQRYATGQLRWLGWHPAGEGFAYADERGEVFYGRSQQAPVSLGEAVRLIWAGDGEVVLLAGRRGEWRLIKGAIDGDLHPLLDLSTQNLALDVWP